MKEFLRIVSLARNHVKYHNAFKKFLNNDYHTGVRNDTKPTNNKKSTRTPKDEEIIRLRQKSDILSKDEL